MPVMTSQYETNLWLTDVNINFWLAEPIRCSIRWRAEVVKILGFVCKCWQRMFYESNESISHESWVNESMSQIWKNKSFGRNNKIKHYFYLICLLASLLPAHARPISEMKSQLGLFVSSILGPAATTTCMPRKITFPDTLQEPFKPSDIPYY